MNNFMITRIIESISEADDVKTIKFEYPDPVIPGQFFMIWIPDVDEIPMSVSYVGRNIKGITFRRVGDATKKLFKLKTGCKIGVRGPYGNGFKIYGENIFFVGGGTGITTLAPAVEMATDKNIISTVLIGAKTSKELLFEERLKKSNANVHVSTDDGSKGFEGLAADVAKELIAKNKFDSVITCGPEPMMKNLLEICRDVPFQASLERYMKCGIGLCGQCCIGEGLRVCVEGPVFYGEMLKNIEDFGVFKRDASGKKIKF